jgi:hypothetical protein
MITLLTGLCFKLGFNNFNVAPISERIGKNETICTNETTLCNVSIDCCSRHFLSNKVAAYLQLQRSVFFVE